jgi:hypothetical protein
VEKKMTPKGENKISEDKQQGKLKIEGKVEVERKPCTKKLECFICRDKHYAGNCPHKKKFIESNKGKASEEEDEAAVNAIWEGNAFATLRTYQINAVGFSSFKSTEVLLDNQANISIVWPELLRQLQPTSEVVRVNGVGGVQLELRETGYLDNFFQVYTIGFTVHMPEGDILFEKKGKLHVADFAAYRGNVLATQVYIKAETVCTHAVQELIRNAGYPSYQELINILQDGNFAHLPNLTAKDVHQAYDLYGKLAAFMWGRITKQAVKRAIVDDDLVLFTGLRLDFCKELGLAFGDYCEVFDGTDNTSRARSVPCVK